MLRQWRENNERKSKDVLNIWLKVLEYNVKKLGNESKCFFFGKEKKNVLNVLFLELLVLEQVCVAALDCNRIDIAAYCVKRLLIEFPQSLRVQKYSVMCLEAQGRYDEALIKLDKLIKEDETNSAPRKRKIAILKAQMRNVEAIKELAEYLKMYVLFCNLLKL